MTTVLNQPDQIGNQQQPTDPDRTQVRTIEIGWILAGRLDGPDYDAVRQARSAVLDVLNRNFSQFSWRMPIMRRPELATGQRVEPVRLLEHGVTERDSHRLDFALVITPADLIGHYKPFAIAAVSRSLDLAVISTMRIDPQTNDDNLSRVDRIETFSGRLQAVVLHLLGHLCGLSHDEHADNVMFDVRTVEDLDSMRRIAADQHARMHENLGKIADLRLEERGEPARANSVNFYLRSTWMNRHEIVDAVRQAKPWQFPGRLSRLTTAAVSAAMVLIMTAETWDMATAQSPLAISLLSVIALIVTTTFIMHRQQLLVHRQPHRLSEQTVITNVSATAIVLSGMLTTLLLLFGVALIAGLTLFPGELAGEWAASLRTPFAWPHYLQLAAVIAALSALIGALGASFEEHHHFRHIIFVDEET